MLTDCLGKPVEKATSNHGRVVNLHDLYVQDDYLFDATKPYEGLSESIQWGLYTTTIPDLASYTSNSVTKSDSLAYALKNKVLDIYDGKNNTQKILAAVSSVSCSYTAGTFYYAQFCRAPAAEAVHAFYPPNVSADNALVGAGKWYLPAEGELAYLYGIDSNSITISTADDGATGTIFTSVNNTLNVLAGKLDGSYAAPLADGYYWSSMRCYDDTECKSPLFWEFNMDNGYRGHSLSYRELHVRAVLAF
jgi:hypothetical protein